MFRLFVFVAFIMSNGDVQTDRFVHVTNGRPTIFDTEKACRAAYDELDVKGKLPYKIQGYKGVCERIEDPVDNIAAVLGFMAQQGGFGTINDRYGSTR